ncbi:hypothetical protein AOLI_G00023540 [Acnodon oligacanthus]
MIGGSPSPVDFTAVQLHQLYSPSLRVLVSARQGSGGQPPRLGGYGEPSRTPDLRSVSLSLASLPLAGRSSEKKNFESSRRWTRP